MYSIYSELSPCGHLAIADKIQISGKSYRGLTGNDSRKLRPLAITELRTLSSGTKMTILLF